MTTPISRRDFVRTGAAAGVAAALPVPLASYLIVENLRRGMSPKDAGM
jgi:H+/Cl- antiporter ClcA